MHIQNSLISFLEAVTGIPLYALFLAGFFLLLFAYKKQYTHSFLLIVFDAINHLSVITLKNFFAIPRPDNVHIDVSTYAFPSGHAAGATFIAFAVFFNLPFITQNKRLRYFIYAVGVAFVIFIGWTRIYLGAHTLAQVIGGVIVGFFWAYAYKKTSQTITKL